MKLLKLGDLHIGVKGDDPWMETVILNSIKQAIDYSKANSITVWIQTGDWFDVRKAVTHRTMEFIRTEIIPLLEEAGITCYITVGNHDMHYKNKIQPNAPREFLSKYSCFKVIDEPTAVDFDGISFDLIPWMCDSNSGQILDFIKHSGSAYCVGHWELNGFYFYKNQKSSGYEPDFLKSYKKVISGHFHTQSEGSNIHYIGTPYTITAGDENETRGFWVFDTKDESFSFIPNEKCYHVRLDYPGRVQPEDFDDCSVRLIATEVDAGLTELEHQLTKYVHELRTINKAVVASNDGTLSADIELQSVMQMMEDQINNSQLDDADKTATINLARQLYTEAVNAK